jgi:serine/threonine-protein kinase
VIWGAFGILPQFSKLWQQGYSWRDVVYRPPARDAVPAPIPARPVAGRPAPQLPGAEPTTGEFGRWASQIRQLRGDRVAIAKLVERLPPSERNLLPEVQATVEALLSRAGDLARTLTQMEGWVDEGAVARLDERIQELEARTTDPERDRRLDLLRRQRQTLAELVGRRSEVEAQFESCVLAMQNVRFDLLRLRSAGVSAALDDLTSATQQARALSADVAAAISAAGEIKELLGR